MNQRILRKSQETKGNGALQMAMARRDGLILPTGSSYRSAGVDLLLLNGFNI
jgi:hypothetical protein